MRLLIVNHFFQQDIDALRAAGGDALEIRTIDYDDLRSEALRILPTSFAVGLEEPCDPSYSDARLEWAGVLSEIIRGEYRRWRFDAFVAPSDVFFYVRDAPEICHRMGIPFIVVQKETTISDYAMRVHSLELRRWAPPVCDWMTCCSDRHKEFVLRTGFSPDLIEVTGQPRFDYYRQPERWPVRVDDKPVVLFFSYDFAAYYPRAPDESKEVNSWRSLHLETESQLWKLASKGYRVIIKPHPQQVFASEQKRIAEATRGLPKGSVQFVPQGSDTREMVAMADVVVGFQSTALIEALAMGRPVIYTGWDAEAIRVSEDLIPFPRWEGPVIVVKERDGLVDAVEEAYDQLLSQSDFELADDIMHEQLGPVDGHAAERTLQSIKRFAVQFEAQVTESEMAARVELSAESRLKHANLPRSARRLRGHVNRLARDFRR